MPISASSDQVRLLPKVGFIIPCFNEEDMLPMTCDRLRELLDELTRNGQTTSSSFVLFVDDGSQDGTWDTISDFHARDPRIKGLKLSINVGHQKALWAGLERSLDLCDCTISLDADLQDDLGVVPQMIDFHNKGNDIVFGVRIDRSRDSFFKKWAAQAFYWLINKMGARLIYNHADFRLLSHRAQKHLLQFGERNIFLRGLVTLISKKTALVFYQRKNRQAGKTKYPFRKMLSFAWNGITAFSVLPIRFFSTLGFLIFLGSIILGLWVLWVKITGRSVPGWTSTTLPLYFFSGIQMMFLGVLGEYIGKIFTESKHRPMYFIDEELF